MSLFHYTDANAVMSILRNQQIWMTDVRFLNDSQEFFDGGKFVGSAIQKIRAEQAPGSARHQAGQYLDGFGPKLFDDVLSEKPRFVCSFSTKGDLLSQWRSYGDYAIEFDRALLGGAFELVDCIYSAKKKVEYSEAAVDSILTSLSHGIKAHAVPEMAAVESSKNTLLTLCDIFKSEHFAEEAEVRSFDSDWKYSDRIKYRARGGVLIPYISRAFPLNCVKAVHVGPIANGGLAEKSLSMFLDQLRVENSAMQNDINIAVIRSEIPYRKL